MLRRQFLQIISDLRAELTRSSEPSVGVSDLASLKQTLNRVYEGLYADYDWPHLITTFDAISLHTGQRYYDFPETMDFDRLTEKPVVWWNTQPVELTRGIAFSDYAFINSEDGATQDPPEKWDVRFDTTGNKEVIEVWPIPASNDNTLQFRGVQKFRRLVDDSDVCRLDDTLVILFAAAALVPAKSGRKQELLAAAQKRMMQLRGNAVAGSERIRIGGSGQPKSNGVIVRVSR